MSAAASEPAPPQAQLMQMATGFTAPFLLRAAAQLRLADHLADRPKTVEQLAEDCHAHAPTLYRLLRTLASIGIFSEDGSRRFGLTPLAEPLGSNAPGSVRTSILSITGDLFIIPWSNILYSVETGQPSFDKFFGGHFFDYLSDHPEDAAQFTDLLIGLNSPNAPAVAAAYDFSAYARIADIGGATGHILTTVLASHPGPRGTIFDLPHNEAGAMELIRSRGMADRVTFEAGNFFESIPEGFDLYMMSHVIHDWGERECLTILDNCRRAMTRGNRLVLIEPVLPEGNAFHAGKMLDISIMVLTPGQERTEPEYRALLEKAGFRLSRVISTRAAVSVVECVAAE